jgi:fluoride exporter
LRIAILLVMLGGALGTLARYEVGVWFKSHEWGKHFPYGTLFVNVTGSFVLALAAVLLLERAGQSRDNWFLLIGTGFCGGYTTFSTFEWETYLLVRDGKVGLAFLNVGASVLAGFLGVLMGVALAGWVTPHNSQ